MRTVKFLLASLGLLPAGLAAQNQPNVIIMLMDDMGVNDIGAYTYPSKASPGPPPASVSGGAGTIDIPPPNPAYDAGAPSLSITPRIDSLADDGVRLTQFYATHPVCTPTRASLMTGSYATRVGLENVVGPYADTNRSDRGLNSTEVTLPELLRAAGYQTGMSGKWHLGHDTDFNPLRHGFERYFGILYSNDMWEPNTNQPWGPLDLMDGETALGSYATDTGYTITNPIDTDAEQSYLLEAMTHEAIDFIDAASAAARPFFLYYAPHTPHVPIHPHPDYLSLAGETDPVARYYDLIREIDARVGEILDRLAFHGIEENTIVIFTSDNGPSHSSTRVQAGEIPGGCGSAYPFRGMKGETREGGQRVPFIARLPGQIPAGSVRDQLGVTYDLYSTLANLAGALLPADRTVDGADLWPLLTGVDAAEPHSAFYYYDSGQSNAEAVINTASPDKWKYTEIAGTSGDLFRIGNGFSGDFQESSDIGPSNPSIQSALNSQLASWNSAMTRREAGWKRPVQIEVENDSLAVTENGTATTRVRLSNADNRTIRVGRFSGDTSLEVSGGSILAFDTSNWNDWQTVTFAFHPDFDTENGAAVFRVHGDSMNSSSDIHVREIFVYENDTMQAVTQLPPPDNDLLLRYRLDETGGTTAEDASPEDNAGILSGSPDTSWGNGYIKGALDFAGTGIAYIDTSSAISASDGGGISAAAWVRLSTFATSQNRWILQQLDGDGVGRTWLSIEPDGSLYSYAGGSDTSGGNLSLNEWHHVAITAGDGNVRLFMNGSQVASNPVAIESNTAPFRIANHKNLDLGKQWTGSIDDLRIYSGVLNPDEIEWLAALTAPRIAAEVSLISDSLHQYLSLSYLQLSGGTGTVGSDYVIDDTSWIVETNTDLSPAWNSGPLVTVPVGAPEPVDPLYERVTVRLSTPVSSAGRQFMRLKVE